MELKNNFAIKCDTLAQKKYIRQVLIDMGYEDDKVWNDERIEGEYNIYFHVEEDKIFQLYNFPMEAKRTFTYYRLCEMYNIAPIISTQPQPLDELIKNFQSEMNKRGFEVEIIFKQWSK